MTTAFVYILAIVIFVIVLNFIMLLFRLRRDRYVRPKRPVQDEAMAATYRGNEIRRRLDREEQDAAQYVELRNKTLALYDEVRRRAAAAERQAAAEQVAAPDESGELREERVEF